MTMTTQGPPTHHRPPRRWPILLLALPAFISVWSGWVGLGELTGFGPVHPLPGIVDDFTINSAITLPIGVESFAVYAMAVWLSGSVRTNATRSFAKWSALGALTLGGAGQVSYHVMEARHITTAPWWIITLVACLPVLVVGAGAMLAHMLTADAHAVHDDDAHAVHEPETVRTHPVHVHDAAQPVHDDDRAHDDPVHDVAQPVRKASQRVHVDAQRAHDAVPMHSARALTASTAVRTVSLLKAPALCTSPNGVRTTLHSDQWTDAAERLCKADPSGRRDVRTVAEILRRHNEDGWTHARIGEHTGCSASTVSRTLTAARAHAVHA